MPLELNPKQPPYYEIVAEPGGTKTYIALLTQEGTGAPTGQPIINNIGNIIWTRDSTGKYLGTLTEAFPLNRTTLEITQQVQGSQFIISNHEVGEPSDQILINTRASNIDADDQLWRNYIKITIYPT